MLTAKKIPEKRVRTPTVLQMEAVECGAAALSIIMSYHGKWRPLEVLRAECGVSRDGSNARNILYGARRNGFEAKGRKASVETALQTEFPFIAFWNFNHFLVIEGYRNGFVYLNDPATGPRRVSLDEFDDAFTGVILVFKPDENFQKDAKPPGLFARLLPRTKSIRTPILLAVLISLTLVIPGLLVPGFAKIFVDDFLIQGQADWLQPLLIAMGITAVVAAALNWLSQSLLLKMETKLALADSTRFVWHVLRLPINFFEQRHPGDISNRIDANDRIAAIVAGQLGESLVSLVTVIFYAIVMFYFDPLLAFIAIGLSLTNILIFRFLARRRGDASIRMQQDYGQFQSASVTGIQAIETLKATGTDDDYFQRWSGFQAKHLNNMRRLGSYNIIASAFPPAIDGLIVASILGIGGFRVLEGAMTAGSLIAMQVLIQNFSNPVNRLVAVGGAFQELSADLARSDDVFKQERDVRFGNENRGSSDTKQLTGSIELRDLSFGYSQLEPPLIENFSLSLRPGSRVALVGSSGSGKSTVAKLISGLFHPWSGEIRFDGVPLQEISVDTLTASIASVSQEVVLFGGSIRSNLSLWDDTLPDSVMIQALRDAQIYDVVSARGDGLDLSVDEDGSNFSGGQSQRLEIARALSSSPRILILDEATSALDPATEKLIDENLRRRGCTCIIVAHRLSTIRDADEIVVMDRGKVVERGSHDELVAAKGYYHGLIAEVEE